MTLYRAQVLDTPDDPFRGGTLRADADAGLLVTDGMIVERGPYADLRRQQGVQRGPMSLYVAFTVARG